MEHFWDIIRKKLIPPALSLMMLFLQAACKDDTPGPDYESFNFVGEWIAKDDNVATLFQMYPLNVDSIYLEIRDKHGEPTIYIEKYKHTPTQKAVITRHGADSNRGAPFNHEFENMLFERPSENRNIRAIKVDASRQQMQINVSRDDLPIDNWRELQIRGIYQINTGSDPPEMLLEFAYGYWGILPPNPEEGFGSSGNGVYGMNNVHRFIKIIKDSDE
jgi:hypothetical protein